MEVMSTPCSSISHHLTAAAAHNLVIEGPSTANAPCPWIFSHDGCVLKGHQGRSVWENGEGQS